MVRFDSFHCNIAAANNLFSYSDFNLFLDVQARKKRDGEEGSTSEAANSQGTYTAAGN